MAKKKLFNTEYLLVNVAKNEAEEFKLFTQQHNIMFKIGEIQQWEKILPCKFEIYYNKELKHYLSVYHNIPYKKYKYNYIEINFEDINNYLI